MVKLSPQRKKEAAKSFWVSIPPVRGIQTETLIVAPNNKIPQTEQPGLPGFLCSVDQSMSLHTHLGQMVKNWFYHLLNISKVRKMV